MYRIIHDKKPRSEITLENLRYQYGAELVFAEDANKKNHKLDGIVFHAMPQEKEYYIGAFNPILDIEKEVLKYSNKTDEAELLTKYAPEYFPKTWRISKFLKSKNIKKLNLKNIYKAFTMEFPNGFVVKPAQGFASNGMFPQDTTDFVATYEYFLEKIKPTYDELVEDGNDAWEIQAELTQVEGFYEGWTLDLILNHPDQVIVQEKLDFKKSLPGLTFTYDRSEIIEARVHFINGVLLQGASTSRNLRSLSPQLLLSAESAAKTVVHKLPFLFTGAIDISLTENDGWKVLELNIGGDSGFLHPDSSLLATQLLSEFLSGQETPFLNSYREILFSSDPDQQIKRLDQLLRRRELKSLRKEFADNVIADSILQMSIKYSIQSTYNSKREKNRLERRLSNLLEEFEIPEIPDTYLMSSRGAYLELRNFHRHHRRHSCDSLLSP